MDKGDAGASEHDLHVRARLLGQLLCYAVERGDAMMVTALLSIGAPTDHQTETGWTPIFYATQASNVNVMDLLIQYGAPCAAKRDRAPNSLPSLAVTCHL